MFSRQIVIQSGASEKAERFVWRPGRLTSEWRTIAFSILKCFIDESALIFKACNVFFPINNRFATRKPYHLSVMF